MNTRSCSTCWWWQPNSSPLAAEPPQEIGDLNLGICQARPPVPVAGAFASQSVSHWPATHPDRFCGLWSAYGDGGDDGEEVEPGPDNVVDFRSAA